MSIPYLVRKKADLTSGERKEQWYAVPKKLQSRGGVNEKELAEWIEKRSGFNRGQVEGILTELAATVEYLLSTGQSVTIRGFGTFQTALKSKGFDHPEEVTPSEVSVSRVYFVADRNLSARLKRIKCFRIPFKYYMPENLLTPAMKQADETSEDSREISDEKDQESRDEDAGEVNGNYGSVE
ncbi:MAG: HU family DNA-binding protein [Bacteroides sp.]|jgi:predicted histone-like DNA-binding protein|nr:HU family DNA-binding protein [Bacteroides sp.]